MRVLWHAVVYISHHLFNQVLVDPVLLWRRMDTRVQVRRLGAWLLLLFSNGIKELAEVVLDSEGWIDKLGYGSIGRGWW